MKLIKTTSALGLAVLVASASPLAWADDAGWYAGANVGRSLASIDDARITNGLLLQGLTTSSITDRDRDTGYKIFGGYQFNNYLALEGGYFNLGRFGFTANTSPLGSLNGNIKLRGLNLDAVGSLPLTDKFSVLGRVGVTRTQARDTFTGTGAVGVINPNPRYSGTDYKLGVGLQYALTDNLAFRAEAERYRVNDAVGNNGHIDLLSVGLIYRFGDKSAPPPVVARTYTPTPAPEPVREVVAAAPVIAPVMVAPPPPAPQFEKITMSSTELFGFDSAELGRPQPKLDDIAVALNKHVEVNSVDINGYTDRLGSPTYNQALSLQRANVVKSYLVSKGVDPQRLRAQGFGEANSLVTCTDKKRAALILCLEPNRRVEIEKITIEQRVN